MTKEQKEKLEKLIEMGWKDVARAYYKVCWEENYTDEYKIRLQYGWLEGVGMENDL
jgi:hypothetical protein